MVATFIFDFDGTIADSIDYFVGFIAKEAKLAPLSYDQKQELRSLSLTTIARILGIPRWRLPIMYFKGRRLMEPVMKDLQPFAEMPELIEKLHSEGHELFIISSNSVRNMRLFLKRHKLQRLFLEIYGGVVVFGKAPMLRRLLKENKLATKNAVYIGDELRDIQAGQAVGIKVVAVTWGFAAPEDIKSLKPDAIADTPAELLQILEEM